MCFKVPVRGRLDHVFPLILLHVEDLYMVLGKQLRLVEFIDVIGRTQTLTFLEELPLGVVRYTARSGNLSRIPLISIEGPQAPPPSRLSSRSWQPAKGEPSCW
jgi:hypothetical protein